MNIFPELRIKGLRNLIIKFSLFSIVGVVTFVIFFFATSFWEYTVNNPKSGEQPINTTAPKDEKATVTTVAVSNITQEEKPTSNAEPEEEIPSNVEQKEKILIAQLRLSGKGDESLEFFSFGHFFLFDWCGSNALVVQKKGEDIEWINILEKKRVKISNTKEDKLLCGSPDGRWVIYASPTPGSEWYHSACGEEIPKWDGKSVANVYRYEVSSGKKERIGVMRAFVPFKVISPDGKRIFLGGHLPIKEEIDMCEPKWERLYFKEKDWDANGSTIWFQDSSGVVTKVKMEKKKEKFCMNEYIFEEKLAVEIFGNNGWKKIFEIDMDSINSLRTGKDKTIYFLGYLFSNRFGGRGDDSLSNCNKWSLYKCKISQNRELSFEKILERKYNIWDYTILDNGSIVFRERLSNRFDKWIRCIDPEQMKEKWVVNVGEGTGYMEVSPDERWLAFIQEFERENYKEIPQGGLFVVKLK